MSRAAQIDNTADTDKAAQPQDTTEFLSDVSSDPPTLSSAVGVLLTAATPSSPPAGTQLHAARGPSPRQPAMRTPIDLVPSSPLSSLFSPASSPARAAATATPTPAVPSPSTDPPSPTSSRSVAPSAPTASSTSAAAKELSLASTSGASFLKASSRARPRISTGSKRIPNSAWVRNNTVGELPLPEMIEKKRRLSHPANVAVGLKKPPLSLRVPKRHPKLNLSGMKLSKLSRKYTAASSRSPSPDVGKSAKTKRSARSSSRPLSAVSVATEEIPYPSPASTSAPATALPSFVAQVCPAPPNLFCDRDGCPLRFHLVDADFSLATSILDHGGELASHWDSTFTVASSEVGGHAALKGQYGTKGGVTSCPLAVSSQWIRESLKAGKLLPPRPFTVRV